MSNHSGFYAPRDDGGPIHCLAYILLIKNYLLISTTIVTGD